MPDTIAHDSSAACFSAAKLNSLTLKNRFIKAGTFENMTSNGVPSDALNRFHGELADGGIAMTTLGYCAVENDGRLNENMMYMHEGIRPPLSVLIADLHQRGTMVSGQMGYCGGFSKNRHLSRRRPLGPSFGLNGLGIAQGMLFCDAMSVRDINAMVASYSRAATFMKSVGFDALEIHFGHGYGLCQFMSPKTNKRKDEYGGSLENRMRLPLRVLAAVREAVGDDFPLLGKISMTEGVRGGLHYDDAVEISKLLDKAGIDGIITSGGTSSMNPMIMFRGGNILPAMLKTEPSLVMRLILRLAGKAMFKDYPYKELYFLEQAKRIREAVNCKMIYVGGASSRASFDQLMAAGFDFIQLGRSLLSDPDLPNRAQADVNFVSRCTHCNECVATIESPEGIHCTQF
ncbi:NADH:flavin oxidoreductase [Zhongshania aliphaticivorans]|uniref:Oxidoreductase n=1 Tax=Zhongshania aliphaticivorans TaxID=1470434 RepID=A0A127M977_9GAMM|nr:NADH:flavin oxidoreductase [Zhongshania aliphaticivorans]AMO69797.1 oxidoreductase [Zhongshania aliphaticivorans]